MVSTVSQQGPTKCFRLSSARHPHTSASSSQDTTASSPHASLPSPCARGESSAADSDGGREEHEATEAREAAPEREPEAEGGGGGSSVQQHGNMIGGGRKGGGSVSVRLVSRAGRVGRFQQNEIQVNPQPHRLHPKPGRARSCNARADLVQLAPCCHFLFVACYPVRFCHSLLCFRLLLSPVLLASMSCLLSCWHLINVLLDVLLASHQCLVGCLVGIWCPLVVLFRPLLSRLVDTVRHADHDIVQDTRNCARCSDTHHTHT
jgi:hypothetical protein